MRSMYKSSHYFIMGTDFGQGEGGGRGGGRVDLTSGVTSTILGLKWVAVTPFGLIFSQIGSECIQKAL